MLSKVSCSVTGKAGFTGANGMKVRAEWPLPLDEVWTPESAVPPPADILNTGHQLIGDQDACLTGDVGVAGVKSVDDVVPVLAHWGIAQNCTGVEEHQVGYLQGQLEHVVVERFYLIIQPATVAGVKNTVENERGSWVLLTRFSQAGTDKIS